MTKYWVFTSALTWLKIQYLQVHQVILLFVSLTVILYFIVTNNQHVYKRDIVI